MKQHCSFGGMEPLRFLNNRRPVGRRLPFLVFIACLLVTSWSYAHPSPNSILLLDVSAHRVVLEANIPLPELALVLGDTIQKTPETLVERNSSELRDYLLKHVRAYVDKNHPWKVGIQDMHMAEGRYVDSNLPYWEVVADFVLTPNPGEHTRSFTLQYDAVMHQVINHAALISIRRDWEAGVIHADTTKEVSVIGWNLADNSIPVLNVNLNSGSNWKGFASMLILGVHHIKEGTDHLLFLLTLLLAAPLLIDSGRWGHYGGLRYAASNLLKVVTAFTIGHSVTLLVGALGWAKVPGQPIEILIAFSILVSAIHAIRPIFSGREVYIAAGFGLIHGLAFAGTLSNLNLDTGSLTLSILGFNLGIELMQLAVVVLIMPWLIILSQSRSYSVVRIGGAVLAGIAAMGWLVERVSGESNYVTKSIEMLLQYTPWIIALFAAAALLHIVQRQIRALA